MRAPIALVAAVVGIAASTVALLGGGATAPLPASAAVPEAAAARPPVPAAGRVRIAASARSSGECSVIGRVVDSDGAALPDARVTIGGATAACGSDGRFELDRVSAAPAATIAASRAGSATLVREVTLWPDARVDVGDLELHAEGRIRGAVLDDRGRPVPGATVVTGRCVATAGPDGAFEIAGLARGSHDLRALAAGHACRSATRVDLAAGEVRDRVELRLDRARTLTGRVVDQRGLAVAGASVRADWDAGEPVTALADAAGGFTLAPLPTGRVRLLVRHPEFLPFGRSCPADGRNVTIALTRSRAVAGRLVAADTGADVAIARVELLVSTETETGPWRRLGRPIALAADDAVRGRFRLPLGIPTIARVVALSDSHAPVVSEPFWLGHEDVDRLILRARAGVRVRGELRDDRGLPVPDAEVRVLTAVGDGGLVQTGEPVALSVRRSNAGGGFETAPLAPGRYRLAVRRPGYQHVTTDLEVGASPAAPMKLLVGRAGTIRGRLRHAGERARLRVIAHRVDVAPAAAAAAARPARPPSSRVVDGEFVLEALAPGRYRLQLLGLARGEEHGTLTAIVQVEAGTERRVAFDLGQ